MNQNPNQRVDDHNLTDFNPNKLQQNDGTHTLTDESNDSFGHVQEPPQSRIMRQHENGLKQCQELSVESSSEEEHHHPQFNSNNKVTEGWSESDQQKGSDGSEGKSDIKSCTESVAAGVQENLNSIIEEDNQDQDKTNTNNSYSQKNDDNHSPESPQFENEHSIQVAKTLNIKWEKDKSQANEEGNNWDEPEQADEREGRPHRHRRQRKRSEKRRHHRLNIHGNSSVDSAFDSSFSHDVSQESNSPIKEVSNNQNQRAQVENNQNQSKSESQFTIKNGCCRECMKAFSKLGKACLCQVPKSQRRTQLPVHGCKYCGCGGCNPIDMRKNKREELKDKLKRGQSTFRDEKSKLDRIIDSEDEDFQGDDGLSVARQELAFKVAELLQMLNNKNQSVSKEMLGFGVPVRHQTYILGCCRKWMNEDEYKQKRPKFNN